MKNGIVALVAACAAGLAFAATADVPQRAEDVTPLPVGAVAPTFEARTPTGDVYQFAPGPGRMMVIFYRGGWCPYCNRHLKSLRTVVPKLRAAGVEVLFLSADRPELLLSSLDEPDLPYTLLSDAAMEGARAFGIAFEVDAETVEQYKGFGIDLEAASGYDHHQLPVPAVYLIEDGVVSYQFADADYKKRLAPAQVLAAAGVADGD